VLEPVARPRAVREVAVTSPHGGAIDRLGGRHGPTLVPRSQREMRGRDDLHIAGTLDRSVKTGAMTLPGRASC